MRVLIVDDHYDSGASLRFVIETWGHECKFVTAGRDAIALCREWAPGAVLLDISMPEMNGCELAEILHATPGLESTRFLAHTALNEDQLPSCAIEFDGYLQKPVALKQLSEILLSPFNRGEAGEI